MMQLHAEHFIGLSSWFAQLQILYLSANAPMPPGDRPPGSGPLEAETLAFVKNRLVDEIQTCSKMELLGAATAMKLIVAEIDSYDPIAANAGDVIAGLFGETQRRLKEDLAEFIFLRVDDAKKRFYIFKIAATIKDAFSRAVDDLKHASRCYALEENVASIYHSMMALEVGLAAMARKFKVDVKPNKSTWGPIIGDIEKALRAELDTLAQQPKGTKTSAFKSAKRRAYLESCQDAALEFRHFKNVWRDHVAHGRAKYDHHDAAKALEHVHTFMKQLAEKLQLKERQM